MPLDKSGSKESVGKNIKTELASGKSKKQAIAIALNVQDRARHHDKMKGKGMGNNKPVRRGSGRGR